MDVCSKLIGPPRRDTLPRPDLKSQQLAENVSEQTIPVMGGSCSEPMLGNNGSSVEDRCAESSIGLTKRVR